MRYLSDANGIQQEMYVCMAGKRSVGIGHAESGTNKKYLLA